jgi:hypothetical protein
MTVTAAEPRSAPPDPEQGVIEEARRRQRNRWLRRGGAGLAVLGAVTLGAILSGGGQAGGAHHRRPPASLRPAPFPSPRTAAQARSELIVEPAETAGDTGICTQELGGGGGSCGGPYPGAGRPLFGDGGYTSYPQGRIPAGGRWYFALTAPGVAAVRVSGVGTFPALADPGHIPAGDRVAVFHLRGGMRATVVPPGAPRETLESIRGIKGTRAVTITPLDGSGHAMRQSSVEGAVGGAERVRFWQRPKPQATGRCGVSMPRLPGVRAQFGEVSATLAGTPGTIGPAFSSCLDTYYAVPGSGLFVSVYLDARHPGVRPQALWGTPVPGRPSLIQVGEGVPGMGSPGFDAPMLARRVGDTWLAVDGGRSLAQRIQILQALRLTRAPRRG